MCKIIHDSIKDGDFLKLLIPFSKYEYMSIITCCLITLLTDALKYQKKTMNNFFTNLDQMKLISDISKRWDVLSLNNQLKQWLMLFHYFQKFDSINFELLLMYRLLNWEQGTIESCLPIWGI